MKKIKYPLYQRNDISHSFNLYEVNSFNYIDSQYLIAYSEIVASRASGIVKVKNVLNRFLVEDKLTTSEGKFNNHERKLLPRIAPN
jgi:hypothetical protein